MENASSERKHIPKGWGAEAEWSKAFLKSEKINENLRAQVLPTAWEP